MTVMMMLMTMRRGCRRLFIRLMLYHGRGVAQQDKPSEFEDVNSFCALLDLNESALIDIVTCSEGEDSDDTRANGTPISPSEAVEAVVATAVVATSLETRQLTALQQTADGVPNFGLFDESDGNL